MTPLLSTLIIVATLLVSSLVAVARDYLSTLMNKKSNILDRTIMFLETVLSHLYEQQ